LAHKDIKAKLLDLMKEKMIKFFGEDAHKSKDYTKIVSDFHTKRLEKLY